MKYLNYDASSGLFLGFYDPEIHGENIPIPNIELTDDQWQNLLSNPGKFIVDPASKTLVDAPAPVPAPIPIPVQLETYFLQHFLANASQLDAQQIGGIFQAKAAIDSIFALLDNGSLDEATGKSAILATIQTPSLPSTLESVRTDVYNFAEGLLP